MKKISEILNCFVFIAATTTIAGVFYEGMALKWYSVVGVLIPIMDFSFIISTVLNLIADRKTKWIYANIFSLIAIIVAIAMKVLGIEYPIWSLVVWYFYIWFLYGIQIAIMFLAKNSNNRRK